MVVIIPSYNNQAWCIKNLKSVFDQKYQNYRVIYIDDCSNDATYPLVAQFIQYKKQQGRTTLIRNEQRLGALANIYKAVHSCDDDEIVVQLDGDDWFSNKKVLHKINYLYSSRDIWITYGQFRNWPTGTMGYCKEIPHAIIDKNSFRSYGHVAGSIRTFYAWLFKKIKKRDLIDSGAQFYAAASDVAYMFPMLEMAKKRFCFVKDVLCTRNVKTTQNDFKVHKNEQERIAGEVLQKKPYQPL